MLKAPTHRIATHPGALLMEQIEEMALSVSRVARETGLPTTRLHEIVHERRGVTAETAIALGEYFGQTPEFWMNAQTVYELSKVQAESGDVIRARVHHRAAQRPPVG